jgi:hypothetical protein
MDFALRMLLLPALLALSSGSAYAKDPSIAYDYHVPVTDTYTQRELLKNWALSVCLSMIATNADARRDANITASAYLEFGKQPIETYDELRELARKFVDRKYGGYIPGRFDTMKCIDLFHSAELNKLVNRHAPEGHSDPARQ